MTGEKAEKPGIKLNKKFIVVSEDKIRIKRI